ncbi:protein containg TaqI-like C-terminal specificity domain [Longilinea arvoryzae]|uniref:site-specific DNA-methyltransferase (adenine-specific) n=1 Tax=Longilinea arvoryzae TaxID=360412 RepID=A0A0K8MY52_9CHLR|nr:TaqI-like C-terminal specificity domain-containing protein [Longilinea arvoryzae]GAP16135.1 protein containg TaqI-like C-terminal specificity domain [Longilinea arvoryzae]
MNNFSISKSWSILSDIEQRIKAKIEEVGVPLKDWDIQINYGIKTGLNEAFIISGEKRKEIVAADPKSAEIIRPILRGRDIKRYEYKFSDLWLLHIPWHFPLHNDASIIGASEIAEFQFKEQFPSAYNHLLLYKDQLLARNRAETGIRYEWYSLQRWGANYSDDFYKQKIVYAETMRVHKKTDSDRFPRFSYSEEGIFLDKTCFMITGDNLLYILPILNSKLMCFFIRNNIAVLDTGGFLMQKIYIDRLPIPPVSGENRNKLETLCVQIFEERRRSLNSYNLEDEVDSIIYNLYGFTRDEIAHIEKISSELRSMSR